MSSSTNQAVRYPAWRWRDWKKLPKATFKAVPEISKNQYFKMTRADPGYVTMRTGADQPDQRVRIALNDVMDDTLPPVIQPGGLSEERVTYLYRVVRHYLSAAAREAVYPEPAP